METKYEVTVEGCGSMLLTMTGYTGMEGALLACKIAGRLLRLPAPRKLEALERPESWEAFAVCPQHGTTKYEVRRAEFAVPQTPKTRRECSCIHGEEHHDPVSGACLWTNPMHGPCPCEATPVETRRALLGTWTAIKKILKEQGR